MNLFWIFVTVFVIGFVFFVAGLITNRVEVAGVGFVLTFLIGIFGVGVYGLLYTPTETISALNATQYECFIVKDENALVYIKDCEYVVKFKDVNKYNKIKSGNFTLNVKKTYNCFGLKNDTEYFLSE